MYWTAPSDLRVHLLGSRKQEQPRFAGSVFFITAISCILVLVAMHGSLRGFPSIVRNVAEISSCIGVVFVIRHGEKSEHPTPGSPDVLGLNVTGWQRARHLRELVEIGSWPRFTHIFASSPAARPYALRERQTVTPIADALGLVINDTFSQAETDRLAETVLDVVKNECSARVIISWEHCRLPSLLRMLGCNRSNCCACWPDGAYDSLFELRYSTSSPTLAPSVSLSRELFTNDAGLRENEYECADARHLIDTRCQLPNGSWLGTWSQRTPVRVQRLSAHRQQSSHKL